MIYGSLSRNAFCFLVEKGGIPVGECWLQKMNIPEISDRYPENTDIRRIDYCLGEKSVWGKGVGTECLRLLMKFAFEIQNTDVLYIMPYDHNVRNMRMAERAGFGVEKKNAVSDSQKAKFELLYKMTREEYENRVQ